MVSDKTNPTGELLSAQKFIGCRVENPRGEGLGRIEDLMIGAQDGLVAYAVVSFGGILRIGNKLFSFPWSSFRVDSASRKVILNLDKKTLALAHGFDKDHWPKLRSPSPAPVLEPAVVPTPPAVVSEAPAGLRVEHWGESWESHGLERS